jgi:hypothetical protein
MLRSTDASVISSYTRRLIALDRRREEGEDEVISDRRFITAPAMRQIGRFLVGCKELDE